MKWAIQFTVIVNNNDRYTDSLWFLIDNSVGRPELDDLSKRIATFPSAVDAVHWLADYIDIPEDDFSITICNMGS